MAQVTEENFGHLKLFYKGKRLTDHRKKKKTVGEQGTPDLSAQDEKTSIFFSKPTKIEYIKN